ncbi:5-formyltetrahydrofolate cyclo-ligase [Anaerotalea alkaliphila]|uniref:5-formyltetrahydrofolate cyclo-ligase n=1 Tax=Anaerotalea alkaliphila TaxID=2662126 RepID=A0A7X5KMT0_9FIRM|nr:5-formyltetrahydrofolate cyclo-ligase [Anaerotalea alkaliphila]NDL68149.1 5-formyltetrahydrofolate cyclo-ligase [Anaerotalea alkaliphila]
MGKRELRREVLGIRKGMGASRLQEESGLLVRRILAEVCYQSAGRILVYRSMPGEVQTDLLIRTALADGKEVCCPRVLDKQRMEFYAIEGLEGFVRSPFGVLEPAGEGEPAVPDRNTLVVVPGLAFDPRGNRLGYGGGYYDRYLQAHPHRLAWIALAYDFQLFPEIPAEPFDIPMDVVLTPKKRIQPG